MWANGCCMNRVDALNERSPTALFVCASRRRLSRVGGGRITPATAFASDVTRDVPARLRLGVATERRWWIVRHRRAGHSRAMPRRPPTTITPIASVTQADDRRWSCSTPISSGRDAGHRRLRTSVYRGALSRLRFGARRCCHGECCNLRDNGPEERLASSTGAASHRHG